MPTWGSRDTASDGVAKVSQSPAPTSLASDGKAYQAAEFEAEQNSTQLVLGCRDRTPSNFALEAVRAASGRIKRSSDNESDAEGDCRYDAQFQVEPRTFMSSPPLKISQCAHRK